MMRTCPRCGETKPVPDFATKKNRKGGRTPTYCKPCWLALSTAWRKKNFAYVADMARRSVYFRRYGITVEDYDRMLSSQDGLCGICLAPPGQGRRFAVDHDHKTGAVRGLLCTNCNTGIGKLQDSKVLLLRAVEWLRSH